ncbi:hypothetical protein FWD20_03585 [Candidatus Saccharibacteria bacterium]|nr:hypothetical protein [Candidatus Saccharibacteria bacterium]
MNNNPFEPVTTVPSDGNPPMTDNAADNFAADSGAGSVDIDVGGTDSRTALSIDGISPSYDDDGASKTLKIDESGNSTIESAASSSDILTDDHSGDFLNDTLPGATDPVAPIGVSPEPAKATDSKPAKPPKAKTVKISLLTVILFVLAAAGIAGAVWFYIQNDQNADALAESQAKVQRLEDELSASSVNDSTTAGQYDGLNDKIKEGDNTIESLTKEKADLTKKNEELNKKVTELTTQNTELNKKVTDVSNLTTRVDTMLKKLEDVYSSN